MLPLTSLFAMHVYPKLLLPVKIKGTNVMSKYTQVQKKTRLRATRSNFRISPEILKKWNLSNLVRWKF